MSIKLPISKSIANRILLLQAIHGDPLMRVSSDIPDDVILLHDALEKIRDVYGVPNSLPLGRAGVGLTLNLKNCGTALRFLEVHLDKCYPGEPITLTGDPRLMERKGKPTSQTNSALLMHGIEISDDSPYVEMTRRVIADYPNVRLEADWSSASYWYEYVAIHGGELLLEGLTFDSIQGDRVVADIYAKYFGVQTAFTPQGAKIVNNSNRQSIVNRQSSNRQLEIDFTNFPDLYPAVALTCEILKMDLKATGTERLKYKESNRLEAVRLHEVRDDHRIAMSLMCADYPVSEKDQACISKSYPQFVEMLDQCRSNIGPISVQYREINHITPIKGVNDEGKGKKFALSKLIHATDSEYLWLHDDDVELPRMATEPNPTFPEGKENLDLIILPLRMESSPSLLGEGRGEASSLLEKLQIAEYAAIQELTMWSAKKDQAVMCSGANLIVRREAWLACEEDLHPEIPSGDDMFLLEAMKRRGYKIGVIDEPDYTAVVRPVSSWRAFVRQRMRWAGKAPKYTDKDIIRCGALVVAANILQILCPPIIFIKFPIEFSLIKKREPQTSWLVALLLELIYPFYILLAFLGGVLRTNRW